MYTYRSESEILKLMPCITNVVTWSVQFGNALYRID